MKAIKSKVTAARAVWHFFDLVRHPEHLDRVFQISDALADGSDRIDTLRREIQKQPRAAAAFRDRPRLRIDLGELGRLPAGTLGRVFAEHMRKNNLDPAAIPTLTAATENEYFRAHFYETHDVWHAITGFDTDVAGELGLQGFYAAQTPGGLPALLIAVGLLNSALFTNEDAKRRMDAVCAGYAMGKDAETLFGFRWADHWTRPIDDVRRELGIAPYVEPAERVRAAA